MKTVFTRKSTILIENGEVQQDENDNDKSTEASAVKNAKTHVTKPPIPAYGVICSLICALIFAINAIFAKMITSQHSIQNGVSRCFVQFLILLPILQYKRKELDIIGPVGKTTFLFLRGFLGSTAMIFLYLSIGKLSAGNAVTIIMLNTVMVPIVARVFLKETLTIVDCVFAFVSFCGVVLIAQPPFLFPSVSVEEQQSPLGIFYALMAAACSSFSFVTIRKLGKETHFVLNIFYYSFIGSITTTILLVATKNFSFPCSSDLFYVFSLGIMGLIGQVFLTLALQWERASTVSVLRTGQIIFVYVLQVVVLKDVPSLLSLIGAGLIFSSSIGIGIRKIINERKRMLMLRK